MNYIKHLTAFFEKVSQDYYLNPTHISLYVALFQSWNYNRFQNPVSICRGEIMRISKIASFATYHKCIKDLDAKGYIKYEPSYNPFKGSLVHIIDLTEELKVKKNSTKTKVKNEQVIEQANEQANEQAVNKHQTSTEQALVSSININKHIKHYKHSIEHTKNKNENNLLNDSENEEKFHAEPVEVKLREKKKSEVEINIPILENVISFFQENNHNQIEAEKFFNYFESNGWLVGGKTKMKNWKAAAKNWMLNIKQYSKPINRHPEIVEGLKPNHLHSNQNKNYDEPL